MGTNVLWLRNQAIQHCQVSVERKRLQDQRFIKTRQLDTLHTQIQVAKLASIHETVSKGTDMHVDIFGLSDLSAAQACTRMALAIHEYKEERRALPRSLKVPSRAVVPRRSLSASAPDAVSVASTVYRRHALMTMQEDDDSVRSESAPSFPAAVAATSSDPPSSLRLQRFLTQLHSQPHSAGAIDKLMAAHSTTLLAHIPQHAWYLLDQDITEEFIAATTSQFLEVGVSRQAPHERQPLPALTRKNFLETIALFPALIQLLLPHSRGQQVHELSVSRIESAASSIWRAPQPSPPSPRIELSLGTQRASVEQQQQQQQPPHPSSKHIPPQPGVSTRLVPLSPRAVPLPQANSYGRLWPPDDKGTRLPHLFPNGGSEVTAPLRAFALRLTAHMQLQDADACLVHLADNARRSHPAQACQPCCPVEKEPAPVDIVQEHVASAFARIRHVAPIPLVKSARGPVVPGVAEDSQEPVDTRHPATVHVLASAESLLAQLPTTAALQRQANPNTLSGWRHRHPLSPPPQPLALSKLAEKVVKHKDDVVSGRLLDVVYG
jgi:hypothetical protein